MQERPNKLVLLTAISRFLVEEVRPALSDPRLNFRALIAAHLASVVASELASDEETVTRDLERLRRLVPEAASSSSSGALGSLDERRAIVADLNARLAARLRARTPEPGELAEIASVLRDSLREKLAIDNPRFDTSLDIE